MAISLTLAAVILGGAVTSFTQTTKRGDVANPETFRKLDFESSGVCRKSLRACANEVFRRNGLKFESDGSECKSRIRDEVFAFRTGITVFLRTETGLCDDSVGAIRYRLAFKKVRGGYRFVQAGNQVRCLRPYGVKHDWGTKLCP